MIVKKNNYFRLFWIYIAINIAMLQVSVGAGLGIEADIVTNSPLEEGSFALVRAAKVAPVYYDGSDYSGVVRAIGDLRDDIERVTSRKPNILEGQPDTGECVIIGTIGINPIIDELVLNGKLDAADLEGKWESFVITTLKDPLPGVSHALVIAGSDKRGTIYGIYELSEQLGVSPWYWWADVPARKRSEAYVRSGRYASGEPVVKYRGIFLNNERPCLTGWTAEKFGGMNSKFYTRVFELLLRLRANYLWPAMWDNAFNEDDPDNPRLADEYGIVMGTSHHEPMMRAHQEWVRRREQYGNGKWNYATNSEELKRFFREGIARNKEYENLVTVGMRGDGDEGMVSTGSIESDIKQLEQIFTDQRQILAEEMNIDPSEVPQLWALFTEVQKFYEHGLRPPEDVTLLWTDDNVGNLRRLPTEEERKRSGGAGIYFHFDMHGGPYAYQWINTVSLVKTGEQMNLAFEYGATKIWIVNVGDLKPLELPIEFFLRQAWNPASLTKDKIADYIIRWAERDFGSEYAEEIAYIVSRYNKYNDWRKPELITPDTFSQLHYLEAERVEAAWMEIAQRAEDLYEKIPEAKRDAYYQLVLHPVKACSLVARMNILAGRNHLYTKQGRASSNDLVKQVKELFYQDQALSDYYNHVLAGGKWDHLMDQPHIGQFDWEPPVVNVMPPTSIVLPEDVERFGVSIEGDVFSWPDHYGPAILPVFDSFCPRKSYLDVFAIGTKAVDCQVEAMDSWIVVRKDTNNGLDQRYWVEIDWEKVPEGESRGQIHVNGKGASVSVWVPVRKATQEQNRLAQGRFATLTGTVAMSAISAPINVGVAGIRWEEIPDYGRGEAALGIYPVDSKSILPPEAAPRLEYPLYLPNSGTYEVTLVVGPVMDFVPDRGMRIAVSFDSEEPQVIDLFEDKNQQTFLGSGWWNQFTRDNVRYVNSSHELSESGCHTLKISMVDPGIVLEKIIINNRSGSLPDSYFGPPERSLHHKDTSR